MNALDRNRFVWTNPKTSVLIVKDSENPDGEACLLIGRTCILLEDYPETHAAVVEARTRLLNWAENLRIGLGAAPFMSLSHPEHAPVIVFHKANEGLNQGNPGCCLSINAIFRKCVFRVQYVVGDDVNLELLGKK